MRKLPRITHLLALQAITLACSLPISSHATDARTGAGPAAWANDLAPIRAQDWSYDRAAHLLERAGFGGTPEEIQRLADMTPEQAVRHLVRYQDVDNSQLQPFDESGIFEPGLDPFPPSRPATTDQAKAKGEALGVKVKPAGNRRMQPVVNKFFYWLRASRLETQRVAYWWANRMLTTNRPLEEKMALFWHGHFATNEEKVRDYRKMLQQLELFQRDATGNFRDLMISVGQDPAMLAFLDAGVNVKGAPNENFAREIMELFTMGVGNYSEKDIREAARAFTGWNFVDLKFQVNPAQHDDAVKTVLGQTGDFDGVAVIDVILQQPVTAEYMAAKLYRFFVRQDITPETKKALGDILRKNNYEIAPLLETMFLSKDFYSPPSYATHIKSPVELVVSTYKKLGLKEVPGVPDFNEITETLGQHLFYPPTVAGWAQGRAWITPGLLIERGNFAQDVVFPDIAYIPADRYPVYPTGDEIRAVHEKIRAGMDISTATKPVGREGQKDMMAVSNMMADRDEDFNTRFASYRGWQMAVEKVKPIPRTAVQLDLTEMVTTHGCKTTADVVNYLGQRFLRVPMDEATKKRLTDFLTRELGTDRLGGAETYMEDPLRVLLHVIMSLPEYQLG
ncbi:MAG TPA: DUF1800 domain-containing protein [Burkholderiales bacterium]|nr:DUF1800 domain-containing protein [Burkholderiales bacterium]